MKSYGARSLIVLGIVQPHLKRITHFGVCADGFRLLPQDFRHSLTCPGATSTRGGDVDFYKTREKNAIAGRTHTKARQYNAPNKSLGLLNQKQCLGKFRGTVLATIDADCDDDKEDLANVAIPTETKSTAIEGGIEQSSSHIRNSSEKSAVTGSDVVVSTLDYLEAELEQERLMHVLASVHFKALYDWFLFLPSIILTLIGGIVSFTSSDSSPAISSSIVDGETEALASLSHVTGLKGAVLSNPVGTLSLLSVFSQSLTKQLNFSGRASLHSAAAVSLKRLSEDLPFKQLDSDFTWEETDAYLKKMNDKFKQAVTGCNSVIPIRISSAFNSIRSELDLHLALYGNDAMEAFGIRREQLYRAAYFELFVTVSNHVWWPFFLPRSSQAVNTTLKNLFRKLRTRGAAGESSVKL